MSQFEHEQTIIVYGYSAGDLIITQGYGLLPSKKPSKTELEDVTDRPFCTIKKKTG